MVLVDSNKIVPKNNYFLEELKAILLKEREDIVYFETPDTCKLIYVNKAFHEIICEDVIRKKCFKVHQNQSEPCSFCTNNVFSMKKRRSTCLGILE